MGLKIVIPIEYQRVKEISLTAMGFRGLLLAGIWRSIPKGDFKSWNYSIFFNFIPKYFFWKRESYLNPPEAITKFSMIMEGSLIVLSKESSGLENYVLPIR